VAGAPTNPVLHNSLGVTLWALGEKNDAIGFFRKALALDPDHADALSNLGVGLLDQGDRKEAEACFVKALALRPNNPSFRKNLDSVRDAGEEKDPA
jgi:Flp pilus assembly protein TadD